MNNSNRLILLLSLLFSMATSSVMSQIGGDYTYSFLRLSPSARLTAMGGIGVPVMDGDIAMAYHQPASLTEESHQAISFNQSFFPADIRYGLLSYGHHLPKAEITMHAGIQYIDYGEFVGYDPTGREEGQFDASENAFFVGASRTISERLSVGANLKFIFSGLESYNSIGLATDLSMIYTIPDKGMGFGLNVRNAGFQLSSYADTREDLPLDIQVTFAKRLEHLPFRFGIALHTLNRWDLGYDDPKLDEPVDLFSGSDPSTDDINIFENFLRHLCVSGEFLLGPEENFNLRFAYRHQRRAELGLSEIRSIAGFSFGVGFRVNRFKIDYGLGGYHLAGSAHHFGISTNIQKFTKDREL